MAISPAGKRYRYTAVGVAIGIILTAVAVYLALTTGWRPLVLLAGAPLVIGLIIGALADRRAEARDAEKRDIGLG